MQTILKFSLHSKFKINMKQNILKIAVMALFYFLVVIPIYKMGKQYGKKLYNQSVVIKK